MKPLRLSYAQKEGRPVDATFRAAGLCGAVPLAAESCIFLLWLITQWWILLPVTLCAILIGVIFATGGLIAICLNWLISRTGAPAPVCWWPSRRELWTTALLLSNFLLSAAIASIAVYV